LNLIENPTQTYLKFGLHYDGLFKSAVLVNLTRENLFKWYCFFDVVLGDNFRYNFDYYVENGYNLSLGFKSQFNQFNRNVAAELSGFLIDLGVNSINMDYSDLTNQYFQSLFVQNFCWEQE
jgi:NTE family protein